MIGKNLIYSIPGFAYLVYILFPFRFWESFVFSNQTEIIIVTTCFSSIMLLFVLFKSYKSFEFRITKVDLLVIAYSIYQLCRFSYPLEKEYFYIAFSMVSLYIYFRIFPSYFLPGLLLLLALAGTAQMAYGVNQFSLPWHNLSHITGIFGNSGLFGGFVALGLVVCVGMVLFTRQSKWYWKVVFVIIGIALVVQVHASGSRASWVAASATILFMLYHFISLYRNRLTNRQWLRYLPLVCLFVIPMLMSKQLYELKKDSADGRLLIARVSMDMVKEKPLFGSGTGAFRAGYLNYQAAYFRANPDSHFQMLADDVEMPFNEFIKILVEGGVIGLLLFFYVIYSLFGKENVEIAQSRGQKVILQSAIIFFLIFGMFSYPFDKLPFLAIFIFLLSSLSQLRYQSFKFRLEKVHYVRLSLLLVICLVSSRVVWDAHRYAESCRLWNEALTSYSQNKEESLVQLRSLYPELKNNPVFLTTFGKALSIGGCYYEASTVLEKAVCRLPLSFSFIELGKCYEASGFSQKAFACWHHADSMVPSRFTPLYLTMKLYFNNGEYEQAKENAKRLLEKKIKINHPEIDKMKQKALVIIEYKHVE